MSQFDKENVKGILEGEGDWFTANLFRLIAKADKGNRAKLFDAFPDEVKVVHKYLTGKNYEGGWSDQNQQLTLRLAEIQATLEAEIDKRTDHSPKIVSYDFTVDNIIAVEAPVGTDPDTLVDQALETLIERCHQSGEISFVFDKVFDPEVSV
jgi:hypothetical protein